MLKGETIPKLTETRRIKIMNALNSGHLIYRFWKGTNGSGYLSHQIQGVPLLREAEVDVLYNEGLLEVVKDSRSHFHPFQLKAAR